MSEPAFRAIEGCRHTRERMGEWADNGACPICLTAEAGMAREALAAERTARQAAELDASELVRDAAVAEAALRRAVAALHWIESFYGKTMHEQGCPCSKDNLCPLHAAVAAPSAARARAEAEVLRAALLPCDPEFVKLFAAIDRLRAVEDER